MNDDDLWIDAALDDELGAAASLALQRRIDNDPALKAAWDGRRALREAVRTQATYHAVPDELRAALDAALGSRGTPDNDAPDASAGRGDRGAGTGRQTTAPDVRPSEGRRFAGGGALRPWGAAAAGGLAASLVTLLVVDPAAPGLRDRHRAQGQGVATAELSAEAGEAVSAHTRALLVDHPIEVASSDQHTVRPWLSARLNFVPPVVDLAPQGYALLGARRDVLAGQTAAALVYRHGAHVISVFVKPATGERDSTAETPLVIRGFNVIQRTQGGMAFCLVSDLNPRELGVLADLLAPLR